MNAAVLLLALAADADLFRGKPLVVERDVEFMFRSGLDKCLVLKSTLGIRTIPDIDAPKGIAARVLSSSIEETTISSTSTSVYGRQRTITTRTGTGYRLRCKIEITAEKGLEEGKHEVKLSWPTVPILGAAIKANTMDAPSRTVSLDFWESLASKDASLKAKKAAEDAAFLRGWLRFGLWVAGIIGFFVAWSWLAHAVRWARPRHAFTVTPGVAQHGRATLVKEIPIKEEDLGKPLEPFTETKSARTFWGGASGVSVTCHGCPTDAEYARTLNTLRRDGAVVSAWFTYSAKVT
ncbi:MAG: hypothetical protein K2W96_14905, partial [Gemmataceae bacterium]|nr:hypothetical protein [Gemmataceae bacterium]